MSEPTRTSRAPADKRLTYQQWKRRKMLRLARNWVLFLAGCAAVVARLTGGILWLLPKVHGLLAGPKVFAASVYDGTDYVFNGQGERPWEPDDKREPLNVYGQTKYEGELAIEEHVKKFFTVRIAWVFGVNGKNFIKTMLNLGKTHDHLTVVNDQTGSPTYTYDLARLLVDMIQTDKYGRYHATNEGICTWYEFACEIFKQAGMNVSVAPVSSDEYPAKAKRPSNSRMDKSKLTANGFTPLPTWQDALSRYLKEIEY